MTVVAKLGSSIVADDAGELRADVLDRVCGQVAELHARRRGRRDGHLGRDRARDAADGASPRARGRSTSCRRRRRSARARCSGAYEERLAARDVHAAQVLLTSSDVVDAVNYLNARETLRRLLEWRVVPVVNENDTTATDEITFGDNDFLSAQVGDPARGAAPGAADRHRRAAHGRPAAATPTRG